MTPQPDRVDFDCPSCKERYSAFTFLAPDPSGQARKLNAVKVASWTRSHVCRRKVGA